MRSSKEVAKEFWKLASSCGTRDYQDAFVKDGTTLAEAYRREIIQEVRDAIMHRFRHCSTDTYGDNTRQEVLAIPILQLEDPLDQHAIAAAHEIRAVCYPTAPPPTENIARVIAKHFKGGKA